MKLDDIGFKYHEFNYTSYVLKSLTDPISIAGFLSASLSVIRLLMKWNDIHLNEWSRDLLIKYHKAVVEPIVWSAGFVHIPHISASVVDIGFIFLLYWRICARTAYCVFLPWFMLDYYLNEFERTLMDEVPDMNPLRKLGISIIFQSVAPLLVPACILIIPYVAIEQKRASLLQKILIVYGVFMGQAAIAVVFTLCTYFFATYASG